MGIVDLKASLGRGRGVPAAEIDLPSLCQHRREKAMGRAGDTARVSALSRALRLQRPQDTTSVEEVSTPTIRAFPPR